MQVILKTGVAVTFFLIDLVTSTTGGQGAIVFDGPTTTSSDGRARVPDTCWNKNYCVQKSKFYPEEAADKLLEKIKLSLLHLVPQVVEPYSVVDKFGDSDDIEDDCAEKFVYETIYHVRDNSTGRWADVFNSPKHKYTQYLRLVECRRAGAVCVQDVPESKYRCMQQYGTFKMVVLNDDHSDIRMAEVVLPVCCVCKKKSSF